MSDNVKRQANERNTVNNNTNGVGGTGNGRSSVTTNSNSTITNTNSSTNSSTNSNTNRVYEGDPLSRAVDISSRDIKPVYFTPTEKRIMALLSDGSMHARDEVLACLGDSEASRHALCQHIMALRKKLRGKSQYITCEYYQRGFYYRHIPVTDWRKVPEHRPGEY